MLGEKTDVQWLLERLESQGSRPALIWDGQEVSYTALVARVKGWLAELQKHSLTPGTSVALRGDYNPETCALLVALVLNRNIAVPLAPTVKTLKEFLEIAECDALFEFQGTELLGVTRLSPATQHPLNTWLKDQGVPGLILFSSGSTGRSKASLLDFEKMLRKFKKARAGSRTLTFLLLDHIGGINTMLHALTSGGTIIPLTERTPQAVCATIEKHRVQLLPTTPTFLNMLLMSEAYRQHDLSSLEVITYGTEPMPAATLKHLHEVFPQIKLKQTYGLSELGILQTKSKDDASLWVKVGGEGYELKVIDNILWIRAESAMVGYLNAPSPFNDEGWFNTGDAVEVDGEYMRILGRKSEIINVGGEKVYPAEVESVLLQLPNVTDATVVGRPSPITGNVVVARVTVREPEDVSALTKRLRQFCRSRLDAYKIPVAVEVVEGRLHGDRFKKARVG
ncbi:long-chain fatty acid--CoA ligase [Corallococcus sp. CA053C]|uniref:class I adenylate-forming enzyme family protein n=1 Tax=Corallococcus sp. CA053C TaxID=2316732 RepID=UPI000EA20458|nr:fatty acid--CoA ligase family protein [Corallococcus sp. CA053C]RKH12990.1 long-chain fatty acid--CoA ligase [Corallococcus sp. CA053C]